MKQRGLNEDSICSVYLLCGLGKRVELPLIELWMADRLTDAATYLTVCVRAFATRVGASCVLATTLALYDLFSVTVPVSFPS